MSNNKKKKKYSGELKEPIYLGDYLSGQSLGIWIQKLDALCKDYGINHNDPETKWFELALKLALEHVPGFETTYAPPKTKRPAHRPRRWTDDIWIYISVELQLKVEIKNTGRKNVVKAACIRLTENDPFFRCYKKIDSATRKNNPTGLIKRYYDIKKEVEQNPQCDVAKFIAQVKDFAQKHDKSEDETLAYSLIALPVLENNEMRKQQKTKAQLNGKV